MDYFKLFGTKNCVFDDLRTFLDLCGKINNQAVLQFLQLVQEKLNTDVIDFDCPDDLIKQNASANNIQRNIMTTMTVNRTMIFSV